MQHICFTRNAESSSSGSGKSMGDTCYQITPGSAEPRHRRHSSLTTAQPERSGGLLMPTALRLNYCQQIWPNTGKLLERKGFSLSNNFEYLFTYSSVLCVCVCVHARVYLGIRCTYGGQRTTCGNCSFYHVISRD